VNLPAVLAYHKVGTPELGGTWCTTGQLRRQFEALRRAGWTAIDLGGFEARLDAPAGPPSAAAAGDRRVLLTFDDAFESFALHAWPELTRLGWSAALFVVSAFVGRRATWDLPLPGRRVSHLDWPALRALQRAGVGIGSHGASHCDLRRLPDRELDSELAGSRRLLEDRLGAPVRALAYPFGRADARVQEAARAAGYTLGFSMCPPRRPAAVDRFALRRHAVYCIDGPRGVLDKVDPRRRLHAYQDRAERAINACAAIAARHARPATPPADRPPDRRACGAGG
jgi:peptidoglycan/xylan/chitin deacetylase (PgdA/CDA1 family)